MNKHRFRIIFNVARGLMMVVGELVKSHTAGAESTRNSHHDSLSTEAITNTSLTLRPLAFLLMCALGLVSILPNPANISTAQAEVIADPNAPANKRPYVFAAPNGVEVVNIQTPGAAGVSHMFYTKLNVPENGLIFNNSRTNVQSQLGGWLQGNPLLATGTARIILNEVTSNHPSYLNGYMEIAGSRAQLIIANPNGISCNGCGFINASRGVLTTGTPILSGGDLTGYRVTSGTIHIGGNGLDASRSNYTDIIARAVEVNAGIWANDLKLTTGANQVNVDNTQAAMIAGNSAAPASGFALDVADLGGMYAGKITLIGTEAGLGVRNAGTISASSGNLTLTVDGRLENSNTVISQGDTVINITQTISNTGTLYAQGNISLTTQANIDNNGLVAAQGSADLLANGVNSYINNTADSVVAAGLKADGTLISSAGVTANLNISATQSVSALGQNLAAGNQTLTAKQLDISGSDTVANHLSLLASNGDIQAQNATVNANQTLTASTMHSLTTNGAILSANQFNLSAHDISNIGGTLIQTGTGDITINLAGDLDNSQGRIATNSHNLILAAHTITNISNNGYQASIEHAGSGQLVIHSMAFDGSAGQIISNGVLNLTATTADMNNGSAIAKQINIDTATLGNQRGEIIQTGSGATNIKATSQLDNSAGVLASNGSTTLTVGNLVNQGGSLKAAGSANLTINATGSVNNSMASGIAASIQAGGALTVNADSVDNTHSEITAGATLHITTTSNVNGIDNSQGRIAADDGVILNAGAAINNTHASIESAAAVSLTAAGAVNNTAGLIVANQNTTLNAASLNNADGQISGLDTSITTTDTLNNTRNALIVAQRDLSLTTGALNNESDIQATRHLVLNASDTITNSGILFAQGNVNLTTLGDLNNSGLMAAHGNAEIYANGASSNINSVATGVIAAGLNADGSLDTVAAGVDHMTGNLTISAMHSVSALGQGLSAGDQTITAQSLALSGSLITYTFWYQQNNQRR